MSIEFQFKAKQNFDKTVENLEKEIASKSELIEKLNLDKVRFKLPREV
jgi:hypothetical protein